MAELLSTVKEVAGKLTDIVGSTRVFTDEAMLRKYAQDTSYGPARKPDVVVQVLTTAEVQSIVKLANENSVPVTPRSSEVGFYGAGIPEQGGIVIDMSQMKKIRRIDKLNKWALFEAGVTYGELQAELAKHGMFAMNPLLPHKDKSVITSCLEREPRITPKHHLDETIITMEVVLPTGDLFHTGSMSISTAAPENIPEEAHSDICNFMGPGIDWFRLIPGSLGTYGIVTVMNVKIGFIPEKQKILFFGFKSLDAAVEPTYHLLRKLIGDECFLLNSRSLATILAEDPREIEALITSLPPYVLVLNLTAGEWFPEEKMTYQENAVHEAARKFLLKPLTQLAGVPDANEKVSRYLHQPWEKEPYWKFRAKGASKEIFFLTQLQRAPEFLGVIQKIAAEGGYPISDIGLYLQPKQNGRAFYLEASFPYDPASPLEKSRVETVHHNVSKALVQQGAFFYRPYGQWADFVYSRTGNLHGTLKKIKKILDPKNIMNPGKLGF
ncbi:MAG: FAD-binding oxidoreductase [Pseudomonadota bacterium]